MKKYRCKVMGPIQEPEFRPRPSGYEASVHIPRTGLLSLSNSVVPRKVVKLYVLKMDMF